MMVFLVYDRAVDEEMLDILRELGLEHYTKWKDVTGVGTKDPHFGDHVWPGLNNVTVLVVEEGKKEVLLNEVRDLQEKLPHVGLRAFVVPVVDEA